MKLVSKDKVMEIIERHHKEAEPEYKHQEIRAMLEKIGSEIKDLDEYEGEDA